MKGRNESAMGGFRLEMPRSYDASPERVFRAWTDQASLKAWLAEGGDVVADPRPDGLFYLGMMHSGEIRPHYGRYLRVESPRLLEFTPRGSRTELRLTHEGLPDERMAIAHTEGWTFFLDTLVTQLSGEG